MRAVQVVADVTVKRVGNAIYAVVPLNSTIWETGVDRNTAWETRRQERCIRGFEKIAKGPMCTRDGASSRMWRHGRYIVLVALMGMKNAGLNVICSVPPTSGDVALR